MENCDDLLVNFVISKQIKRRFVYLFAPLLSHDSNGIGYSDTHIVKRDLCLTLFHHWFNYSLVDSFLDQPWIPEHVIPISEMT